jgi:hypothetical protein
LKAKSFSKEEFCKLIHSLGVDLSVFRRLSSLLYVEFGMKPNDASHESELILAMMDVDYKQYLRTQLETEVPLREEVFFMLNLPFWY